MSPKKSEDAPLKKMEKEKRLLDELLEKFDSHPTDMEILEELKRMLECRQGLQISEEEVE